MYVPWGKLMRKVSKLPYKTYNYLISDLVKCKTVKLDRRLGRFVHSLISCKNDTGKALIQIFSFLRILCIFRELYILLCKYNTPCICLAWPATYHIVDLIENICQNACKLTDQQRANIAGLQEW